MTLSYLEVEIIQCRKAAFKLAAAPSTPPASISKTPMTAHNSSVPMLSLLIESTEAVVTVPDYEGPKKREAEASTGVTATYGRGGHK